MVEIIIKRIQMYLTAEGLSSKAFEQKANLHPPYLNRLINRHITNPSLRHLQTIANGMEIHLHDLLHPDEAAFLAALKGYASPDETLNLYMLSQSAKIINSLKLSQAGFSLDEVFKPLQKLYKENAHTQQDPAAALARSYLEKEEMEG